MLKQPIPIVLMLFSTVGSPLGATSPQAQALVEGNTAFALDLYGQIKAEPGNLCFSPYSISTALAMLILLPGQVDGCGQLEKRLTPALLSGALKQMRQQKIEIFLPRFKN